MAKIISGNETCEGCYSLGQDNTHYWIQYECRWTKEVCRDPSISETKYTLQTYTKVSKTLTRNFYKLANPEEHQVYQ